MRSMRPTTKVCAYTNLKRFLGVQHLRRGKRSGGGEELAQLGDPLLLVEFVLVGFLNFGVGEVEAEQFYQFVVGLGSPKVHGVEISFEHAMNRGTILHGRSRSGGQAPVALELELQSATLVGVDSGCAEASMQTVEYGQLEPQIRLRLGGISERAPRENVETFLGAARRNRRQKAAETFVGD